MQSLCNAQTIFLHDFAIPLSKVWVEGHSEQKEIKKLVGLLIHKSQKESRHGKNQRAAALQHS